jgi:hypothetical protein
LTTPKIKNAYLYSSLLYRDFLFSQSIFEKIYSVL